MAVELNFGYAGRCRLDLPPRRIQAALMPPPALPDLAGDLRAALEQPLDFPALGHLFTPDDHVVLALDRGIPGAATVIAEVWRVLQTRIRAENVMILQPADLGREEAEADPRRDLPADVRDKVQWKTHDPSDPKQLSYLAMSAHGERIYLSRDLLDADVTVSIGQMAYDPVIGVRGTSSVFFPGLSDREMIGRAHGLSHSELEPDDDRPLRQTIDEVAWLLGTQFTIQVIAGAGPEVAAVLGGAVESVAERGRKLLAEYWLLTTENRAPFVIAAVDADAGGHGWNQVGAALAAARNLVTKGGRVVVLTELAGELGPGLQLIRDQRSPRNAIQPLRLQTPADWIAATQLASAADWAHLHFMSRLPRETVESLFLIPLAGDGELQKLIAGDDPCILLGSAQHAWGHVQS